MTILFSEIIANTKLPFVRAEIDTTKANAGTAALQKKVLVVGYKTSAGTADLDTVYSVSSVNKAKDLFGGGSLLHNMAQAYFQKPEITDVSFIALTEPSAGTAATGNIAFSGTATAAGQVNVYIAGRKVTAAVASGDAANAVASAVTSAINAKTDLPVTAVVNSGVDTQVDLTVRTKGEFGNKINIRFNYGGETTAAGIAGTITALTGGAGQADYADLWAAIGDSKYDFISIADDDATTIANVKTELDRRVNANVALEGVCILGSADSLSTVSTFGNAHNNFNLVVCSVAGSPSPSYEIGAELTKIVAIEAGKDPARPFQGLTFDFVKVPELADRLTLSEQSILLDDGVSVTKVNADGKVTIQRLVTTYNLDSNNELDLSMSDLNTVLTVYYLKVDFVNYISNKYPRNKLASDGQRVAPGQAIVTPGIIKGECLARFAYWEDLGLVEDEASFKSTLIVERDATNKSRVNIEMVPNVINQLRQVAVKLGFVL